MSIIGCVYIDHQDIIDYPVDFVIKDFDFFDHICLFGSDEINTKYMEEFKANSSFKNKITCYSINSKINKPNDIAVAQNKCIEFIKTNFNADYTVLVQADISLLNETFDILSKWCIKENINQAVPINVQHIKLYVETFQTHWGGCIIGRDSNIVFTNDGATINGLGGLYHDDLAARMTLTEKQKDIISLFPYNIDIGYISANIWYKKIKRHAITWSSDFGKNAIKIYQHNPDEFIKLMMEAELGITPGHCSPKYRLINIENDTYKNIINHFKLLDEFNLVKERYFKQ